MAVAAVFGGTVSLPSTEAMRKEYQDRVRRKGAGRTFHSLKDSGQELAYVAELLAMVNLELGNNDERRMSGHRARWLEAYGRRRVRQDLLFSRTRDASLEQAVIDRVGC